MKRSSRLIILFLLFGLTAAGLGVLLLADGGAGPGGRAVVGEAKSLIGSLLEGDGPPEGLAMSNGRIEAVEVDVSTLLAGRLLDVLVQEGDGVSAGQVLARVDTDALAAQLRLTQAQLEQAQKERKAALAGVAQRQSELDLARSELARARKLTAQSFVSEEQLDRARTQVRSAKAALEAVQAQVEQAAAAISAAEAGIERVKVDLREGELKAPRDGRVLYRLAEPGEVLASGQKVLTLVDLTDVYMVLFLPEVLAGQVRLGAEARILLDAQPDLVIPARVSFVAPEAQFTPKQVETRSEREKLVFRIKARISPELLARYASWIKGGLPGVGYVRLDPTRGWPERLKSRRP
jgi:HlyD family secretion protein